MLGEFPIDTGTAVIEADPYGASRYILKVNGVPSSHVDLDDPTYLDFEYMRWMEPIFTIGFPAGQFDGRARKLRVLHLGGGGCSMARWVAASYENARQVVVELDAKLAELVRVNFEVPRAPLVRLRVGDAAQVLPTLSDASRDVIIRDVFAGSTTPRELTTASYAREAQRVLDAGGVYIMNCGDTADLAGAKAEAATLLEVFEHVAMVADPPMLKGRRYGNIVFLASDEPLKLGPAFERSLRTAPLPAQLVAGEAVRRFATGAAPITG
ncbi:MULTISPECIES: spermidine synthase [Glutamicibacter]|uniref:spermidine synthase n=1 Tax=Glutamicibacter TaxID=1742989 RepID=UPI000FFC5901|nr:MULTISPECIES: fused MFS/spermidine synthase [Glutamicibacter]MDV2979252.1 fused MFS/spermidine synthase [Actinomycetes bacterium ARC8]RWZ82882.1 methyltransferase domain-containing protein [Glutamicibacter sp. HZAU]WIV44208.1 fused MFS/spermidine synthase [Glutamicibacter nicotianae]